MRKIHASKNTSTDPNNKSNDLLEAKRAIIDAEKEFRITSKNSKNVISRFILILKKDMVINGEDEEVREEIKKITDINEKVISYIVSINEEKLLTEGKNNLMSKITKGYVEFDVDSKIVEFIERILKIYKKKLEKEQEGWLDKLSICFCKIKIMLNKKIKKSRLQDEPQG